MTDRQSSGWASLAPLAGFAIAALLLLSLSRVGLMMLYADRVLASGAVVPLLVTGLRFDLVVVAVLGSVPLLITLLAPAPLLASRAWSRAEKAWLSVALALLAFNEVATPAFLAEFGVRPNRQYVEYLGSPGVVVATLWQHNPLSLLAGIGIAVAAATVAWRTLPGRCGRGRVPTPWGRLLVLLPLLVGCGYTARGSLGHRPLTISNAALTVDSTVNDLALNSTYSAAYAIRQLLQQGARLEGYGRMPAPEILRRVEARMQITPALLAAPGQSTEHLLVPTVRLDRKPNLVILLQESLGAQYFASLGGQPVATHLERWRGESFWFDQLYASGTRSARGIEAVVTGFLPTRTSSVIKLEGAQHGFFTLARALQAQGYRTEFIYGGDASFDNMRRFFLGNGFDRVIDQSDLQADAAFTTTWGVSDEDLYARVHREAMAHDQDGQPTFTLVFSTSNHPPYDFPDGRIALFEQPKQTHRNAARYADFAVAAYLDRARASPYWQHTLFTVVADHESRTIGDQLVPIFSFHIPAFIAGGPVRPRVVARLASQIDLLPTTLSLMGLSVRLPATGIDQSRTDLVGPGLALMQYHDTAAYRVGDHVAVLAPHQPVREFRIAGTRLIPEPHPGELARDALAATALPILAYQDGWYR